MAEVATKEGVSGNETSQHLARSLVQSAKPRRPTYHLICPEADCRDPRCRGFAERMRDAHATPGA